MKRRTRIYYTPEQKAIIWNRYKQGDSLHDIASGPSRRFIEISKYPRRFRMQRNSDALKGCAAVLNFWTKLV